jgi:uroporphyrinogen decarboxylase
MDNTLLLKALQCKNAGRAPIWLMRQAGRYMPEYRQLREKHSFLEMCHHPNIITEVTLMPVKAFSMDAAILFSDILMIPEALGVGLQFEEKLGPVIARPIHGKSEVEALPKIEIRQSLDFISQGIKRLKKELKVPLLGFAGAPFTVASYMVEGGSSKDLNKTKQLMYGDKETFKQLLGLIADYTIEYLKMQIDAGVDALQIFDSWAGFLAYPQFNEFSIHYIDRILKGVRAHHKEVPIILFSKGTSSFIHEIASISPNAISLDWCTHLPSARRQITKNIALQGNLDPDLLYAPFSTIKREATALLDSMKGDAGFIVNLGHGITPKTPFEGVKCLVDTVKSYS